MTDTERPPSAAATPQQPTTSGTALVLVAVVVGFIAGVFGFATGVGLGWTPLGTRPTVLEGTVTAVTGDGYAIGVDLADDDAEGEGFVVAGALWRVGEGAWNEGPAADGTPTCLTPDRVGEAVRLAAVPVRPSLAAPGRRVVAWVECEPVDR